MAEWGPTMPTFTIITLLVAIGLFVHLFERYVPLSYRVQTILRVSVLLAVGVWLMNVFGAYPQRLT